MIEILTNLPAGVAVAAAVAELYRGRWSVEGLFLRLTTVLKCEVNALGYPPAAVFGFGVALAAGSVYAGVKGALRRPTGRRSRLECRITTWRWRCRGACPGLWIAIPAETWVEIGGWSVGWPSGWSDWPEVRT